MPTRKEAEEMLKEIETTLEYARKAFGANSDPVRQLEKSAEKAQRSLKALRS